MAGEAFGVLPVLPPAGGPDDELSPLQRSLQSGIGTIGAAGSASPVRFLAGIPQSALASGVANWSSSVDPTGPLYVVSQNAPSDQPSGLPGMLLDYMRNIPISITAAQRLQR